MALHTMLEHHPELQFQLGWSPELRGSLLVLPHQSAAISPHTREDIIKGQQHTRVDRQHAWRHSHVHAAPRQPCPPLHTHQCMHSCCILCLACQASSQKVGLYNQRMAAGGLTSLSSRSQSCLTLPSSWNRARSTASIPSAQSLKTAA